MMGDKIEKNMRKQNVIISSHAIRFTMFWSHECNAASHVRASYLTISKFLS